jgi:hypothetical protein
MGDFLSHYASQLGSFVGGLIAGALGGSLLTLRVTSKRVGGIGGTMVDQSASSANGDIVGGNKTTLNGGR